MKKIVLPLVLAFSVNSQAFSIKDKISTLIESKTLVPCALAIAVPAVMKDYDHMGMGYSACAAVAGYNMLDDSLGADEQRNVQKQMDNFLSEAKKDLKSNFEQSKRNYAYYQEVIRDTVGQEFARFDERIEQLVDEYMNSQQFQEKLEKQAERGLTEAEKESITEDVIKKVVNSLAR